MGSGDSESRTPAEDAVSAAGFGRILAGAWFIYRRSLGAVFRLYLGGMLFLFLLEFLWLQVLEDLEPAALAQVAGALLFSTLIPALVGSVLVAKSHLLMTDALLGPPSAPEAGPRRRLDVPSLLQSSLVAATGAMFFGILPGFALLSIAWWGPPLLVGAIVIEGRSFPDAWARTLQRARGHVARVTGITLLVTIVIVVVNFVVLVPLIVFLARLDTVGTLLAYSALALAASVLRPLIAATILRLYFDLRARSEGLDLAALESERSEEGS